jgi:hypothetical protein
MFADGDYSFMLPLITSLDLIKTWRPCLTRPHIGISPLQFAAMPYE